MNKTIASIIGGAVLAASVATASPAQAVNEDEPGFNCYTMGNRQCGPSLRIVTFKSGLKVAVLAPLDDGRVFASAKDGRVFERKGTTLRRVGGKLYRVTKWRLVRFAH